MYPLPIKNPKRYHLHFTLLALIGWLLFFSQSLFSAPLLQTQLITNGVHGGSQSAVKITANGNPVLAFPFSVGGVNNVTVIFCGTALCNTGNVTKTLSGTGGSIDLAMVLDANDAPVISYYFGNNMDLRLVRCSDADCSSHVVSVIDTVGNVGKYNSIQLDGNSYPVISYYDATNGNLKLAHCADLTCATFQLEVVDGASTLVGEFSSLALDSSGNPVISYYDGTNDNLNLAHCSDPNCVTKNIAVVDSTGNVGQYTSLALDSSGNPVISYYDGSSADLQFVSCANASCSIVNPSVTVDASSSSIGFATSLALDSNDRPHISYSDNTNKQVKLVRCGTPTCSANNLFETLDATSSTTSWVYSALTVDSFDNSYVLYSTGTSAANGRLKLAKLIDDSVAPTANPAQSPAANSAGWNNSNVTVTWNWSDNTGGTGINAANCTTTSTSSGEGTITLSAACQDLVGNLGNANYIAQVDQSVPTIIAAPVTPPNAAGWYNNDVSIAFTCNDALSGIPANSCPVSQTLSAEGNAISSTPQIVTDNAGNLSLLSNIVIVQIDKTAPVASPQQSHPANEAGWNNTHVTVAWHWSDDAGSGIDPANCITDSATTNEGETILTATCKDLAGNSASSSLTIYVDVTPLTVTASASKADNSPYNAGEWSNQAISVHFVCSDATSQVANCPADQTISGNGITPLLTETASDMAGNSSQISFGPIQIDTVKPTIAGSRTPAANGNGWNNSDVIIGFSCSDTLNGSGISTNTVGGLTITVEGIYPSLTNSGTCGDHAGNLADSATVADIRLDKTAPSVTITGVIDEASYLLGQAPVAGCATTDSLSGVAHQATLTLSGGNQDGTGAFTASCAGASDIAGNESPTVIVGYTVLAPTPTPTATSTATATLTDTPTATPNDTPTATDTPTVASTNTPTATPTDLATPTPANLPPNTTLRSKPANPSISSSARFTFIGEDAEAPVVGFECQIDNGGFTPCTSPKSYTNLVNGVHLFEVRAIDSAGAVDPSTASYLWEIVGNSSITIIHNGNPDVTTAINYKGSLGSFNLAEGSSTLPQSRTFVRPYGSYTITQSASVNWYLHDIQCIPTNVVNIDHSLGQVIIDSSSGDVTCTFDNLRTGRLLAYAYHDRNGNGSRGTGEEFLADWEVMVDGDAIHPTLPARSIQRSGVTSVTAAATFYLPGGSTYTICETQQVGWLNTQPGQGSLCYTRTITPATSTALYFGNRDINLLQAAVYVSAYHDSNSNGRFNTGEQLLGEIPFTITGVISHPVTPGQPLVVAQTTISTGATLLWVPQGLYSLCQEALPTWINTQPGRDSLCYTLNITTGNNQSFRFGLVSATASATDPSLSDATSDEAKIEGEIDQEPSLSQPMVEEWQEEELLIADDEQNEQEEEVEITKQTYLPLITR